MTKEDIIRMAQEAQMPFYWRTGEITYLDKLQRFAELVVSAERERFADECIDLVASYGGPVDLEAAIRARGNP